MISVAVFIQWYRKPRITAIHTSELILLLCHVRVGTLFLPIRLPVYSHDDQGKNDAGSVQSHDGSESMSVVRGIATPEQLLAIDRGQGGHQHGFGMHCHAAYWC